MFQTQACHGCKRQLIVLNKLQPGHLQKEQTAHPEQPHKYFCCVPNANLNRRKESLTRNSRRNGVGFSNSGGILGSFGSVWGMPVKLVKWWRWWWRSVVYQSFQKPKRREVRFWLPNTTSKKIFHPFHLLRLSPSPCHIFICVIYLSI